jgi:uncharacterized membrane protein YdbT with pleckstrin-like domain
MSYPKHLIQPGETVALDLRPHWWYFSKHILTGIPLFILFVLVVQLGGTPGTLARYLFAALAVAWVAWLVLKYFQWTFTHFVVSDKRVIFRTGVLAKHGVEVPLERINNINFNQGIWERVIGAGDLEIESAGKDGKSTFEDVRHPNGVQQEIYIQIEANARKQASWSAPPAGSVPGPVAAAPSVPEQIQQLAALRDQGNISAAEYEAKKAELLDRM